MVQELLLMGAGGEGKRLRKSVERDTKNRDKISSRRRNMRDAMFSC
jgi:hypothetical protein